MLVIRRIRIGCVVIGREVIVILRFFLIFLFGESSCIVMVLVVKVLVSVNNLINIVFFFCFFNKCEVYLCSNYK